MNITAKIITAIVAMKKLKIQYDDGYEIKQYYILPHLLGKFKNTGNLVLSAWDENESCWKSFLTTQILSIIITDDIFEHTNLGYNPQDKRMSEIISCIPTVI